MTLRRELVVWCAAVAGAAVATLALALLFGGGAPQPSPQGLDGRSRLPAWGADVAGLVAMLTGIASVGISLLGLAARPDADRVRTALTVTGSCWVGASAVQLWAELADLRGEPDPLDSRQVRAVLLQLGFAVLTLLCARLVARRPAAIVATVASVAGLLPVALAGHAASADRPLLTAVAVSTHIGAAAVWVGGLAGLAWLATTEPITGPGTGPTRGPVCGSGGWSEHLGRFSIVAGWCAWAIGVSGIVAATAELDDLGRLLTTRYGAIVTLKAVMFAGLCAAGGLQRRYVLRQPVLRRSFLTVAGGELVVMSLTVALASALAGTPPPG
jgi:putative copper export protein